MQVVFAPNGSSRAPKGSYPPNQGAGFRCENPRESYPGLAAMIFLRYFPWSFSYTRYYGAKELPQDPEKSQGDH